MAINENSSPSLTTNVSDNPAVNSNIPGAAAPRELTIRKNFNTNIPSKPSPTADNYTFPADLISGGANGRNYYTQITFTKYVKRSIFNAPTLIPMGGIALPLPQKINDVQSVIWEAESGGAVQAGIEYLAAGDGRQAAGAAALVAGAGLIGSLGGGAISRIPGLSTGNNLNIAGSIAGLTLNPFLTMLFKSPSFKEHNLNWTFAPNSPDESRTLQRIIDYFKFNMLPSLGYAGVLLNYPNIAWIKYYPDDFFTHRFKPCAVASVNVDYSAAGMPSFFKGTNAPTIINFSVTLKEIEYWLQHDYGSII